MYPYDFERFFVVTFSYILRTIIWFITLPKMFTACIIKLIVLCPSHFFVHWLYKIDYTFKKCVRLLSRVITTSLFPSTQNYWSTLLIQNGIDYCCILFCSFPWLLYSVSCQDRYRYHRIVKQKIYVVSVLVLPVEPRITWSYNFFYVRILLQRFIF